MRFLILSFCLLVLNQSISAQFTCGTHDESHQDIDQKKLEFIKRQLSEKSLDNDSVAITFHIVNNAAPIETVLNEITQLNNYFSGSNITFFACGSPRFIDSGTSFYSFNEGDILNQQNHVFNTINVYYVRQVTDNVGNPLCGYAYLPGPAPQSRYAMVSSDGGCLIGATTLAHELGHFYGLLHTHSLNGGREYVNGSNCDFAGDGFCDTPADPNLSGAVDASCRFVGGIVDPNGDPYRPSVGNLMSYAPPRCTNRFTPEQFAFIRYSHETANNFVLNNCNFFPDFEVASETVLTTIRSDQTIAVDYTFENKGVQEEFEVPVFIYLSDDPTERGFIIKKDTISFSPGEGEKLESFDIELPLNSGTSRYFLTILVDPSFAFLELEEANNLYTIEFEVDNTSLEDEVIFPNPTKGNFKLFLRDDRLANNFVVSIYDMDGRLQRRTNGFKNGDEHFTEIDISSFREGLYVIDVYFTIQDRRKTFKIYKTD